MAMLRITMCTLLLVLFAAVGVAADLTESLKPGKADLKSAGNMAFGPDGVLFVGDSIGGAIFAIDTQDRTPSQASPIEVTGLAAKIAGMLGTMPGSDSDQRRCSESRFPQNVCVGFTRTRADCDSGDHSHRFRRKTDGAVAG